MPQFCCSSGLVGALQHALPSAPLVYNVFIDAVVLNADRSIRDVLWAGLFSFFNSALLPCVTVSPDGIANFSSLDSACINAESVNKLQMLSLTFGASDTGYGCFIDSRDFYFDPSDEECQLMDKSQGFCSAFSSLSGNAAVFTCLSYTCGPAVSFEEIKRVMKQRVEAHST